MIFNFEKLEVYQIAVKLIKQSYKIAQKLPRHEEYVLKPQLLRAITSVALNIAEGSGRKSTKEFCRFIRIAIGSLQEAATIFKILLDLQEINESDFKEIEPYIKELYFKLIKLEKSLKKLPKTVEQAKR